MSSIDYDETLHVYHYSIFSVIKITFNAHGQIFRLKKPLKKIQINCILLNYLPAWFLFHYYLSLHNVKNQFELSKQRKSYSWWWSSTINHYNYRTLHHKSTIISKIIHFFNSWHGLWHKQIHVFFTHFGMILLWVFFYPAGCSFSSTVGKYQCACL